MYDAYLVGLTCLFHAFSAGVCWRARRVAGLRTARCAASCADLCAVSCAARSAEPCEAVCSLFKKRGEKKGKKKFFRNFKNFHGIFFLFFVDNEHTASQDSALRAAQLTAAHEICSVLGEFWDAEKIPYKKCTKSRLPTP